MDSCKNLPRQQDKFDRLPIETLEEKYRKLEFRLGGIQRLGTRPIRDKITSSGLDSIQSTPIPFDSTHSNPMQSDLIQSDPASSNPVELNAIRIGSRMHPIQVMALVQCHPNPIQLHSTVEPSIHLLGLCPRRLSIL